VELAMLEFLSQGGNLIIAMVAGSFVIVVAVVLIAVWLTRKID